MVVTVGYIHLRHGCPVFSSLCHNLLSTPPSCAPMFVLQAALQWKASKAMPFQTAMRRENRPSKQHPQPPLTGRGGSAASQHSHSGVPTTTSLPSTPAEAQIRAVHAQRAAAQLATPAVAGDQAVAVAPATAAAAPSSADPARWERNVASAGGHSMQVGQPGAGAGQRQVASAGGRGGAAVPLR